MKFGFIELDPGQGWVYFSKVRALREESHVQSDHIAHTPSFTRIHPDRTFGRHSHHSDIGLDPVPVFARARENARRAACQSNEKQIGLGIAQYTQDYDEKLPFNQTNYSGYYGVTNYDDPGSRINYLTSILPYTKSIQIYRCPSSTPSASFVPTATSNSNYVANTVLLESQDDTQGYVPSGRNIASIPNPSSIIEIQETPQSTSLLQYGPISFAGGTTIANIRFQYWHDGGEAGTPFVYSNDHFDGGNMLYADGHVKWRKDSTLIASDFGMSTAPGVNTPSSDTTAVSSSANYGEMF